MAKMRWDGIRDGYANYPTDCDIRVVSLGAGVQSTTVALMAYHGLIPGPMPDAAVFADTGWEPSQVYRHLEWLESVIGGVIPVHRASNGNIRDNLVSGRFGHIPSFHRRRDGSVGRGTRQCTSNYKLKPIGWKIRELRGKHTYNKMRPGEAEILLGITTDEAMRMKPAQRQWQVHRWPLIELGMSRRDCLAWMRDMGYPEPPKSSCIGCPFHNNAFWRMLRDNYPEEWADAWEADRLIRRGGSQSKEQYLHRSLQPLEEAPIDEDDRGGSEFGEECEGMCGV